MPVITISSDIGWNDYLIGAIKGQIISTLPAANIVDVAHQLSASDYHQAAYICNNAFKYFPAQTIHVVVLNFFEKLPEKILIVPFNDQYIICPDNGIITMICETKPSLVFEVPTNATNKPLLYYTAMIAVILQQLCDGKRPETFAANADTIHEIYPMRSAVGPDWIDTQVIFVDNFENVVVNLKREEFEEHRQGRDFKLVLMRNAEFISKISHNYAQVQPGENLISFNSAGYLEIAVNKGNAAGLFGLQQFNRTVANPQHKWLYQTVRIIFQ